MSYKVISGYTVNTPYQEIAKNLEDSLKKFSVDYKLYGYTTFGSWEKNCQHKAHLIKTALIEFCCPVVWIDADAVLLQSPSFFENLDCDMSCHFLKSEYNPNELLSGTVYFAPSNITLSIVDKWIELNLSNKEWDQKNLQLVVEEMKPNITPLPKEYIKIDNFEKHQGKVQNPVIVHYQASRKYRKKM